MEPIHFHKRRDEAIAECVEQIVIDDDGACRFRDIKQSPAENQHACQGRDKRRDADLRDQKAVEQADDDAEHQDDRNDEPNGQAHLRQENRRYSAEEAGDKADR